MSVCYHRGLREQWYLYRKYLKLTPRAFLCASKEKGHDRFRRGLVECGSDSITFISKEKAPTLAKPGRHFGVIHNPEKWITTRAVLVQVIVGGRVLKKWPCGREYHLTRIYWSLPHR